MVLAAPSKAPPSATDRYRERAAKPPRERAPRRRWLVLVLLRLLLLLVLLRLPSDASSGSLLLLLVEARQRVVVVVQARRGMLRLGGAVVGDGSQAKHCGTQVAQPMTMTAVTRRSMVARDGAGANHCRLRRSRLCCCCCCCSCRCGGIGATRQTRTWAEERVAAGARF